VHQHQNAANDVGLERGLGAALVNLQVDHVEFTVEGDEIEGRVADIAYLGSSHEDLTQTVSDKLKAAVHARLDLDRLNFELNSNDNRRGTRLRWDIA
jgi:hypothetical protein